MSPNYRPRGQGKYDKDDERDIRQELKEHEAERQKSYSKEDEKEIKEELDNKSGEDKE